MREKGLAIYRALGGSVCARASRRRFNIQIFCLGHGGAFFYKLVPNDVDEVVGSLGNVPSLCS
jgi:hypothetical protein